MSDRSNLTVLHGISMEERQVSYDQAFDSFYSGEELDELIEPLKSNLLHIISCAFRAGYRAAGGSLPPHF